MDQAIIEIISYGEYPSCELSNFAPHKFILDNILIYSMESFLQSLRVKDVEMQKHVCTLVGYAAKKWGRNKNWQTRQTLHWQGVDYKRDSREYQDLLDRAYMALAKNSSFRRAILATGDAELDHSIGRTDYKQTVLTRNEFCNRLHRIRKLIKEEKI